MHHRVIKRFFMCSLMVTLLTSSLSFANIDSYLEDLDLEDTRVILRALNNKFKVDWLLEFKPNVPGRKEKTQKVLNFLIFILDERFQKIESLSTQQREKFGDPRFNQLLNDWYLRKADTCNDIKKTKLRGECENSDNHDLHTFEDLSCRALPNEIADSIIEDFVILSHQTSMVDFPPEVPKELGDMIPTSSVTTPAPVASSSTLVSKSSKLSKRSLNSKHRPLKPMVNSLALVASSSTLIDTEEDSERLRLQQDMKNREMLLLKLDEKGAKIALHAILNNYIIPLKKFESKEFKFKDNGEIRRYKRVHDYLNCILQNKKTKAEYKKEKASSADAESAAFVSYWYDKKRIEYEGRLEMIWGLFRQVEESNQQTKARGRFPFRPPSFLR